MPELVRPSDFPAEEDDEDDVNDEDFVPKASNPFARLAEATKKKEDKKPTRQAANSASSRIFTLSSMRDNSDDEDDEEKGQAFYAGGSETSGQQILGPPKRNPEKIITDLFAKAKEY